MSILYVKVKIYTSSLLHCYQLPIFNLKYIHCSCMYIKANKDIAMFLLQTFSCQVCQDLQIKKSWWAACCLYTWCTCIGGKTYGKTIMAAERSENLKKLVWRITHNVNRTETGNGGANTQSASVSVPNRANSTNEELNQRFMLPRSREAPPSSNSTHAAVQNIAVDRNSTWSPSRNSKHVLCWLNNDKIVWKNSSTLEWRNS